MKKHIIVTLILGCFIGVMHAQTADEVLKRTNALYQDLPQYVAKMKYTIYKDATSQTFKDEQLSVIVKSNDNFYFKLGEAEVVMTDSSFLKISHPEKMMLLTKSNSEIQDIYKNQAPFATIKEYFSSITMLEEPSVFRIVFDNAKQPNLPYSKMVIEIDKDDYAIQKQTYFFQESVEKRYRNNVEDETPERLVIQSLSFNKDISNYSNVFNLETYITLKNNTYQGVNRVSDYKILIQ